MASIYLASPFPNATVPQIFFTTGAAYLDAPVGGVITIYIKTPLGAIIDAKVVIVPPGNLVHPWAQQFDMTPNSHEDCEITANLQVTGSSGPPITSGVSGVDIHGSAGTITFP